MQEIHGGLPSKRCIGPLRNIRYSLMLRSVHEKHEKEKASFGTKELFCGGGRLRSLRAGAL